MKPKILVVEDSITDVIFLKKTLEKENYDIFYAENGTDALCMVEKENPDMVILDILLPDIDGFEICKRIRNNDRFISLPILFYSAIKTIDDKLLGLEMGASDFLCKDASDQELLIRIKNLLKIKNKIDNAIGSSFFDPLTRAYSKEYFKHRMNDECIRSKRYKRDFSCLMIDVDNFETVNNTFGFHTGDRMLKKIASLVSQNVRSADEVCRYNEDEFGVLLPETNLRGAYAVAEKVRQYLAMTDDLRNECSIDLTVSCGVSYFGNEVRDMDTLIQQANQALKQAKQEGRNQTRFYS